MGAPQFAQQVDNSTTNKKVFTEAEVTANTANQYDADEVGLDLSSSSYDSGEQNISGAKEVVVSATENSGSGDADLTIEWTDGTGDVLFTEQPSDLESLNGAGDYALLIVKSTHFQVKASGSSTDTDVTINAH